MPVPPPDSEPAWLLADSNLVEKDSLYRWDTAKHVLKVAFSDSATYQQRVTAIAAVEGEIVGGFWEPSFKVGYYYVRVPGGLTAPALDSLADLLNGLPGVSMASKLTNIPTRDF